MMELFKKVPDAWREVIYYLLVLVMIVAIVFDVVTADQITGFLDKIILAVSAVGFLMAGVNTNNGNANERD